MAINISSTTYNGDAADNFITLPLENSDTLEKNLCVIEQNIKKKRTLPRMDFVGATIFQARTLNPSTSVGDVSVTEKVIEPFDFSVYVKDINIIAISENYWNTGSNSMNPAMQKILLDRQLEPKIENLFIYILSKTAGAELNRSFWMGRLEYASGTLPASNGDTTVNNVNLKYFDGIMKRILSAGSGAIPIASPSAITVSNIFEKLDAMIVQIPSALLGTKSLKFVMNPRVKQIYLQALRVAGLSAMGQQVVNGADQNNYGGYMIETTLGLTDTSTILLGQFSSNKAVTPTDYDSGNFYIGTSRIEDANEIEFAKQSNGSEGWYFKMLMKFATQIGYGENIVYHTLLTD